MASHRMLDSDHLSAIAVWTAACLVGGFFLWLLSDIVWHGVAQISWEFLTAAPLNAGRDGGIGPILVSTALILLVCMVVALPIGLGAAILLAEFTTDESLFGRADKNGEHHTGQREAAGKNGEPKPQGHAEKGVAE